MFARNGRLFGVRSLRCGAAVAFLLAGCVRLVEEVDPTDPDDGTTGSSNVEFTFEADQDPVLAAQPFVEDELVVQPFPGADPAALTALYADIGAEIVAALTEIEAVVLRVEPANLLAAAAQLAASGLIETIQKNYLYSPEATPNDTLFARQDHLPQINASAAWDVTTGSSSIIIGIVDTGVDGTHPDLSGKILDGVNIYTNGSDYSDAMGHGTQVAGTAAAMSNNTTGVAGVSWGSPILAVRVGNAEGLSTGRHIAAGILWAMSHGAKVINASFAPLWSDRIVRSAAQQAFNRGCVVVISAGNAGGITTVEGYDEALFVGAVAADNTIAGFSDRGPFVDVVAPGTGVRTTARGGDYSLANGTSFAAPIVAGVAALALSVEPNLRPASVQAAILSTTLDLGSAGKDTTFGAGLIDAAAVVAEAARLAGIADSTPPTVRVTKPAANAVLSGRYTATVEATDTSGVADVVLSIDGVPFATDTRSPYSFVIDTSTMTGGAHTLSFIATDAAANRSTPRAVSVTFAVTTASSSATTITFRSPVAGSTVTADTTIRAAVADTDGLALLEWLIDGQSVLTSTLTGTSSGVSYQWRAASATRGTHTITLVVTDVTGAQARGTLSLAR